MTVGSEFGGHAGPLSVLEKAAGAMLTPVLVVCCIRRVWPRTKMDVITVRKTRGHRKRAAAYWRPLRGPNMGYSDERPGLFLVLTEVLVISLILSELTGKVSVEEFSCNSFSRRSGPAAGKPGKARKIMVMTHLSLTKHCTLDYNPVARLLRREPSCHEQKR